VTSANGCIDTEVITITSNTGIPAPTASATLQPTCTTPTGTIVVTAPTGANIQYSIGGAYQTSGTFTGLTPNSYNVTAQDMTNGCISSATVIVINPIPASPSITLVSQTNISCSGLADGALDVSVNGGLAPYVVSWNPNVGTGTSISNLTPGNYSINVIDANGCSTSETYIVTSPSPLVVTGVANDIVCGVFLGSITTSVNGGTGPFTYAWSPNSEVTPDLNNLYVGIYVVTVTDVNGCQDSESFDIALSGNLTLDITPPSASINEGDTIDLSVTGATSYIWTPSTGLSCNDCPNPIATPDVTTTYTVSGTDAAGCTGTASILIYVEQYCKDFFVPNIFSPNGKGPDVNNTLCVYGSCIVELQYEVFNRWGEKVFETTDTSICWDGNWRGEPVGSGVFAYKLRAVLSNGEIVEKAGNLTVVY
jgi:gliding motility-associated-like protein